MDAGESISKIRTISGDAGRVISSCATIAFIGSARIQPMENATIGNLWKNGGFNILRNGRPAPTPVRKAFTHHTYVAYYIAHISTSHPHDSLILFSIEPDKAYSRNVRSW